jgi:hypothetical protein
VKAWKAALAAAIATAAIAVIVIAPMAQSSGKRHPGLKVVTVDQFGSNGTATARCPRGFVPIAGGFDTVDGSIVESFRSSRRGWQVGIDVPTGGVSSIATCAKGTGGFRLNDAGER